MKKCKQIIAKFIIIYWASHQSSEKKKREKSAVTYRLLKPQQTPGKKKQEKSVAIGCLVREYGVKYFYFYKKVELFCRGKYGTL